MYAIGSSARGGFGSLYVHDWSPGAEGIDENALAAADVYYRRGFGVVPVAAAIGATSLIRGLFNPKATQANVVQRFQMAQAGQNVAGSATQGPALATLLIDQVYQHAYGEGNVSWQANWQEMLNVASPTNRNYMNQKMGVPTSGAGAGGVTGSPNQPGSMGGPAISQAGITGVLFSPVGLALGVAVLLLSRKRR